MHQSRRATKKISQRERANLFGRDPAISRGQKIQSATEHRNRFGRGSSKHQSAMEYLMTYGWAILIIAVVLGVLYYLGVFNGQSLAPRLQPGSCHVARTSAGVENFGVCAGLPEFVAKFDGTSSYVSMFTGPTLNYDPGTISAWVYPTSLCNSALCTFLIGRSTYGALLRVENSQFEGVIFNGAGPSSLFSTVPSTGQWYQVVETYDGSTQKLYVNGVLVASQSLSVTPLVTTDFALGACVFCGLSQYFQGSMANVQVYNASLSAAEVKALYMEGIGGAPITPQSVAGWWPLNGDANDYSGNNNNGQSVNVQYTNTWLSTYSAP